MRNKILAEAVKTHNTDLILKILDRIGVGSISNKLRLALIAHHEGKNIMETEELKTCLDTFSLSIGNRCRIEKVKSDGYVKYMSVDQQSYLLISK